MLIAEMLRPQSLALEYARHVGVLAESPEVFRSSIVIHRWYGVLAGWTNEPADEEALDVALGLTLAPEELQARAEAEEAPATDGYDGSASVGRVTCAMFVPRDCLSHP